VACVLEGGYNLNYIPVTVNSLMRVLKYDYYPNETNVRVLRNETEKNCVYPNLKFLKYCRKVFSSWEIHWKCL